MRTLLMLVGVLLGMLVGNAAFAGGVVPQGMGLYQDGRVVDFVPADHSVVRWYSYGASQTERALGELAFASASVDLETPDFRLFWGGDAPAPTSIVAFSFKPDPLSPGCVDDVPGNCTLAQTACVGSYKDGAYKLCQIYRVSVYVANIKKGADRDGIAWEERLYAILRHEWGHVLGLAHDGTGPMANGTLPFTSCQLAKWAMFDIDPDLLTWIYPSVPECQAQGARLALHDGRCPNVE